MLDLIWSEIVISSSLKWNLVFLQMCPALIMGYVIRFWYLSIIDVEQVIRKRHGLSKHVAADIKVLVNPASLKSVRKMTGSMKEQPKIRDFLQTDPKHTSNQQKNDFSKERLLFWNVFIYNKN